ncbi:MAG: DinB family protein [Oryzihumus sp.]
MSTTDVSAEHQLLLAHLNAQRRHVLGILEGLDDEALRRPVLPSGWSCLGLLRHLALDDERFWFQAVLAGDPAAIAEVTGNPADAWQVGPETSAESVFALYRAQAERADALLAEMSLDTPPAWWPDFFGGWRLDTAREVVLHVLTETAVHAGHLDAARELIDGRTWLVLS